MGTVLFSSCAESSSPVIAPFDELLQNPSSELLSFRIGLKLFSHPVSPNGNRNPLGVFSTSHLTLEPVTAIFLWLLAPKLPERR